MNTWNEFEQREQDIENEANQAIIDQIDTLEDLCDTLLKNGVIATVNTEAGNDYPFIDLLEEFEIKVFDNESFDLDSWHCNTKMKGASIEEVVIIAKLLNW